MRAEDKRKVMQFLEANKEEMLEFLIRTIQTPSLSCHEGEVARLYASKMQELGYDEVEIDGIGNVLGWVKATEPCYEKCLLFNGHMDHVPPGKMVDPYAGLIIDAGRYGEEGQAVYGRGASDMKGALAAMVFAAGAIKAAGIKLKRDLLVTPVVLEEMRGQLGTKYLIENDNLKVEYTIVGEASNLDIALGHRGIIEHIITTSGKSAHASQPEHGVNAFYKMMDILTAVRLNIIPKLPADELFGKTTMTINTCQVSPGVSNVIPDSCTVTIDTRNIPSFTAPELTARLRAEIEKLKLNDPELEYEISCSNVELTSYTGLRASSENQLYPFYTSPEQPLVKKLQEIISMVRGRRPQLRIWKFATDGGYLSTKAGIVTVGFGPGDERYAHTADDHILVADVFTAARVYALIALEMCT
ncbi:MAG: M20/M25/M40 family metallo-hydrolase [Clostridia bacterium]|nr:M20/M25/M40 family metallo-hydrolase [Clostridia bacterium]